VLLETKNRVVRGGNTSYTEKIKDARRRLYEEKGLFIAV
jgi:hypothetical protein